MVSNLDLAWAAGIVEGEGCFRTFMHPRGSTWSAISVAIGMTDRDIIERLKGVLGFTCNIGVCVKPPRKDRYIVQATGVSAAGIMMTLYKFMGIRRRAKIRECLSMWRVQPNKIRLANGRWAIPTREEK